MPILFIDTNAFLNLYHVTQTLAVLQMLEKVQDHIFVTKKIVDEFARNKLDKAVQVANGYATKSAQKVSVPDLLTDDAEALKTLRKKAAQVTKLSREIEEEFRWLVSRSIDAVADSEDLISRTLKPIFDKAISPGDKTIERARLRREMGEPPGTPEQGLGDQLNWEQLLEHVREGDDVWIISDDTDYRVKHGAVCYLNARLRLELQEKCGTGEIYCFSSIADGVADFVTRTGIGKGSLPSAEVLEEIRADEEILSMQDRIGESLRISPVQAIAATQQVIVWLDTILSRARDCAANDRYVMSIHGIGPRFGDEMAHPYPQLSKIVRQVESVIRWSGRAGGEYEAMKRHAAIGIFSTDTERSLHERSVANARSKAGEQLGGLISTLQGSLAQAKAILSSL